MQEKKCSDCGQNHRVWDSTDLFVRQVEVLAMLNKHRCSTSPAMWEVNRQDLATLESILDKKNPPAHGMSVTDGEDQC